MVVRRCCWRVGSVTYRWHSGLLQTPAAIQELSSTMCVTACVLFFCTVIEDGLTVFLCATGRSYGAAAGMLGWAHRRGAMAREGFRLRCGVGARRRERVIAVVVCACACSRPRDAARYSSGRLMYRRCACNAARSYGARAGLLIHLWPLLRGSRQWG
jgi:hypothetical protein